MENEAKVGVIPKMDLEILSEVTSSILATRPATLLPALDDEYRLVVNDIVLTDLL
jgi:hypothetical protein